MTSTTTTSAHDPRKLDSLLSMLAPGRTDEEQFAGLLTLAKYVKVEDEEAMGKLFRSLNFKFLDRLLKQGFRVKKGSSEKKPNSLPPSPMVAIAVNIITPFFSQEHGNSDILLARLPLLVANLNCKEQGVAQSILEACLSASASIRGATVLARATMPTAPASALCHILKFSLTTFSEDKDSSDELTPIFRKHALDILKTAGHTLMCQKTVEQSESSGLLLIFNEFAAQLAGPVLDLHLDIASVLVFWLDSGSSKNICGQLPAEKVPELTWKNIRIGLVRLFQTPIHSRTRALALRLATLLVRHFGFGWMTQKESPNTFSGLLLRLAATDVRIGLEEVSLDSEKLSTDSRKRSSASELQETLVVGMELLSHTVQYLSALPEEDDAPMPFAIPSLDSIGWGKEDDLSPVLLWLREAHRDAILFIADWAESSHSHPILLNVMRAVSIYLAQDPALLEEADSQHLPLSKLIDYLEWISNNYDSCPLIKELELVSPHGAQLITTMCESESPTSIEVIQDHAEDLVKGLLKFLKERTNSISIRASSSEFGLILPDLLPALRAIKDTDPTFNNQLFRNIYSAAQSALGTKDPL